MFARIAIVIALTVATLGGGGVQAAEPTCAPNAPQLGTICPPVYVSGPGGQFATFHPPVALAQVGGPLTYVNMDLAQHDVISKATRDDQPEWCELINVDQSGKCPLFGSLLIGIAKSSPVYGLDGVQPATPYEFRCSIHPNMSGYLIAGPKAP